MSKLLMKIVTLYSTYTFAFTLYIILNVIIQVLCTDDKPCMPRIYYDNSTVCVCNATYCDTISQPDPLNYGEYVLYSTTLSGKRFEKTLGVLNHSALNKNTINDFVQWVSNVLTNSTGRCILKINKSKFYQTIEGFGGSFTDSVGMNFYNLSEATQKNLIDSYFSKDGLEYNMGRVPIGSSDFSLCDYGYNTEPENDIFLSNFSLSQEDYDYKIPLIKEAMKVATSEIYLIGSVWTPPKWMKTNHAYRGLSFLISDYYQTYADYHLRFLEEYDKNDLTFWAITTGNEPAVPIIQPFDNHNLLGWSPVHQSIWIANNLGPTIKNSKYSKTLILAYDDCTKHVLWWMTLMALNRDAIKYIDGIALHWYTDHNVPIWFTDYVLTLLPDKFLISTEASINVGVREIASEAWDKAEYYADNILDDLNHLFIGWIDWNLAVNNASGPSTSGKFIDSLIRVFPEDDEFVKQPMFYAMGHFSKFIPRGSKRVSVKLIGSQIYNVAFLRPDGTVVVVFLNKLDTSVIVTVQDGYYAYVNLEIEPHSIQTLIYRT